MINVNHLAEAAIASGIKRGKLSTYIWHLLFSIKQAILLMIMSIASIVHGFFPFLFDFWLMRTFLKMLESLKKNFPNYFNQLLHDKETEVSTELNNTRI
jgi:hypothetical protein